MTSNAAAQNSFGLKWLSACCLLIVAAAAAANAPDPSGDTAARPHKPNAAKVRIGLASFYGDGFDGDKTASGETFDKNELVAAHPSYPIGTRVLVTNLRNGRSVTVRIVDRGPASEPRSKGVIIDVSERVASDLGFRKKGKTRVRTEVVE